MIVCVATNASVDKLFEIERLVPGEIHRPRSFVVTPGGKGLNVARAAATLGADVTAVALLAGDAGRWVEAALAAEGVRGCFAWASSGDTRASLSVAERETGRLTEFYEDGAPISAEDWAALLVAARAAMQGATWLTVSGSLPPGAPDDGDATLIRAAREAGRPSPSTRGGRPWPEGWRRAPTWSRSTRPKRRRYVAGACRARPPRSRPRRRSRPGREARPAS